MVMKKEGSCPKCGQWYAAHNDDGSCIADHRYSLWIASEDGSPQIWWQDSNSLQDLVIEAYSNTDLWPNQSVYDRQEEVWHMVVKNGVPTPWADETYGPILYSKRRGKVETQKFLDILEYVFESSRLKPLENFGEIAGFLAEEIMIQGDNLRAAEGDAAQEYITFIKDLTDALDAITSRAVKKPHGHQ